MSARGGVAQPAAAGSMAAVVGFASTFAVVLAGLRSVGADAAQAASGLLVLCVSMGVLAIVESRRQRVPISIAWSTPGAAMLVAAGPVAGGYDAAVGAFLVAAGLTVVAGLWGAVSRWIAAVPPAIASAMLAGILLQLCLAPVRAVAELPLLAGPAVLVWAVLMMVRRAAAAPAALVAAIAALALDGGFAEAAGMSLLPSLTVTAPAFSPEAVLGLAVPLFLVTMVSQNLAGLTVLRSHGFSVGLGGVLRRLGLVGAAGAPFGAFGVNLAAITAALCAGPEADPDPGRRWIAAAGAGAVYVALGLGAGLATALLVAAPPLLFEAVAGLALLGALAAALRGAAAGAAHTEAAIITLVVTASGVAILGIAAPFWGLLAGLGYVGLERAARRAAVARTAASPPGGEPTAAAAAPSPSGVPAAAEVRGP